MKVLIPNTLDVEPSLLVDVWFENYDPTQPISSEHYDAEVLVVWGNPAPMLKQTARLLPQLRWVQTLSAGVNDVIEADFHNDVIITSGRGLHDGPVAEHTLSLLLASARRLHEMRDAQRMCNWAGHLGGLQPISAKRDFRSLESANIIIWGFGGIAERLAHMLKLLGANVQGIARSAGVRSGFSVSTETELDSLLPQTDVLVIILPSVPTTKNILNDHRLAQLPKHAWVVNVGRGDTLDESALVNALKEGRLAGAALDVFATEPLPQDSPLWSLSNVIISPHAAGGRPIGASDFIIQNIQRFIKGETLENHVDLVKGY